MFTRSPMWGVEKPDEPNREVVLTKEEYENVLAHCSDEPFKEIVQVAFECGPRPQEILRVTAKDIDLDLKAWVFERLDSKGKKRRRVVFLNDAAFKVAQRRMKEFPQGPIYRNADGEPWTPSSVSCRFARMKKWVGQKYCLYHLRHSFCHHALKAGVDPVTLSKLMGHVDANMICRVYSHLLHDPQHMRDALHRATKTVLGNASA
jgi:integrase